MVYTLVCVVQEKLGEVLDRVREEKERAKREREEEERRLEEVREQLFNASFLGIYWVWSSPSDQVPRDHSYCGELQGVEDEV